MRINWIGVAEDDDTKATIKEKNNKFYTFVEEEDNRLIFKGKYGGEMSTYTYTFSSEPGKKGTLISSYTLTPFDDRDSADAYFAKLKEETYTHLYGVPDATDLSVKKQDVDSDRHYIAELQWISYGLALIFGEYWSVSAQRYYVISHTFAID